MTDADIKSCQNASERIWIAGDLGECGNYYPNAVEAEGEHGGFAVEYTRADLAPVVKPLIWREDAGDELAHNGLGWLYRITWANDPEVGFLLYRHESSGKTRLGAHGAG